MTNENMIFHFSRLREYDIKGTPLRNSLTGHPLYYLNNNLLNRGDSDNEFLVKCYKSLLLLHSLPFNFTKVKSFFNDEESNHGGYELVPYGVLCLFGGLLYRQYYYEKKKIDLYNLDNKEVNKYKMPKQNETFFVKDENDEYCDYWFSLIQKKSFIKYAKVEEIINKNLDIHIKNKLISLFKSFVDNNGYFLCNLDIKIDKGENDISLQSKICEYQDIVDLITFTHNKSAKDLNKILRHDVSNGYDASIDLKGKKWKIVGFTKYYTLGLIKNNFLLLFYDEGNEQIQMLLNTLYNHKCGVLTNNCTNSSYQDPKISTQNYKTALNGFANTLKSLCKKESNKKNNNTVIDVSESRNTSDDDFKKSIYIFIKQYWDKWLCGIYNRYNDFNDSKRPFSVPWFNKQFLFIDSYYNDITNKLTLNCSKIYEEYKTAIDSENMEGNHVYTHLGNIANKHHCIFNCYPDFLHFNKDENNNFTNVEKTMEDIFRPIPYSEMNDVEVEHQFVVMKANRGQFNTNRGQYTPDGFDIWSSDKGTDIAPTTFKNVYASDTFQLGYKIPAFGVEFSKMNNHLFKSIEVGMDDSIVTEQSIRAMANISQLGNDNKRAITFYGDDLYSVYSMYSYVVTITMMGDVQIQPLMYFQLMNIPLFRGAYIVMQVKHSVRAGEFITTFTGMKLSKIDTPQATSWFTISPTKSGGGDDNYTNDCENEEYKNE